MDDEPKNQGFLCTNERCGAWIGHLTTTPRDVKPYSVQACILCGSPLVSYRFGELEPDELRARVAELEAERARLAARVAELEAADLPVAIVSYTDEGHSGAGWYWHDAEYPEEGAYGAYPTSEEAEAAARVDYVMVNVVPRREPSAKTGT